MGVFFYVMDRSTRETYRVNSETVKDIVRQIASTFEEALDEVEVHNYDSEEVELLRSCFRKE